MRNIKYHFFGNQIRLFILVALFLLLLGSTISNTSIQPEVKKETINEFGGPTPKGSLFEWATQNATTVNYNDGTGSLVGTSNVTEAIEEKQDEKYINIQNSGNHQKIMAIILYPFGNPYPNMNSTSKILDGSIEFGGWVNTTLVGTGNLSTFEIRVILNNSYQETITVIGGQIPINQYGDINISLTQSLIDEMRLNNAYIHTLNLSVYSEGTIGVTNRFCVDYLKIVYKFAQPPNAPDFNIESLSDGGINLTFIPSWNGGDNINGYEVYRSTTSGELGSLINTVTGPNFFDSGLTLGTTYYYTIRAKNRAGTSENSTQKSALSRKTPDPPTLNSLINHQNGNVELTWTPGNPNGAPILQYVIFRSTDGGSYGTEIGFASGAATAWNDTTITTYNLTYYYRIAAQNEAGNGSISNQRNIRPFKAPSAPTITNVQAGQGNNTITWSPSADFGGSTTVTYRLWWGIESDNLNNSIPITTSPFVHLNLSSYLYYYKIEALNHLNWGTNSSVATGQPSGSPTRVRNLAAVAGNYSVNLTWIAPQFDGGNPVSEYRVYRKLGSTPEELIAHSITTLGYNDTTMELYGEYRYRVVGVNIYGEGDASYVFATPKTRPMKPTTINIITGFRSIMLNWEEPVDGGHPITHYQIWAKNGSGDLYPLIIQTDRTYNHTNLTPGMNYTYWISALNDLGWGIYSDPIVQYPDYIPSPPIDITKQSNWFSIYLRWSRPVQLEGVSIPTKFYIYRGTSNTSLLNIGTINALNLNNYNDSDAEPGVKYYYAIASWNQYGLGTKSAIFVAYRLVKIVLTAEATDEGPKLSWNAVENAAKYAVFRGLESSVKIDGEAPIVGDLTTLTYTDTSLEDRGIYYYVVVAYDSDGLVMGQSESKHQMFAGPSIMDQAMEFLGQYGIFIGVGAVALIGIIIYRWRQQNSYMRF